MVKELSKRSTLMCPACLGTVHGIERLVEKKANGPAEVDPWRAVGVQSRIIPKHCYEVDDHEAEAAQCNLRGLSARSAVPMNIAYRIGPVKVSTRAKCRSYRLTPST